MQYTLGEDANEALLAIFDGAERHESFGNARFARTLFEQALNAQSLRLRQATVESLGHDELQRLTPRISWPERARSARSRRRRRAAGGSIVAGELQPLNVWDYEALAAERLDPGAHGYYAGGAGDELTLRWNVEAFTALAAPAARARRRRRVHDGDDGARPRALRCR